MSESTSAATGQHTADGLPHGYTALTPFHVVRNAAQAIDFYRDVFGARLIDATEMPDGQGGTLIGHATVDFGIGRLQISDPMPGFGLGEPPTDDVVYASISVYVPDVDDVVAKAEAHGATIREPVTTFVSGDRFGSIMDPFGVRWAVLTRVEDLSDEESAERVRTWAAAQG